MVSLNRCTLTHRQRLSLSGYSNRWGRYRLQYLKANPLCVHCLQQDIYASATIVDHIIPIQGEADVLFWPESNHRSLCPPCHNRKTVQTDPITKAKRKQGIYQEWETEAAKRRGWLVAE